MPTIDERVVVVRDADWQYVRVPLSVQLPGEELDLRSDVNDGTVTLARPVLAHSANAQYGDLQAFFDQIDAIGDRDFRVEQPTYPPREIDLFEAT